MEEQKQLKYSYKFSYSAPKSKETGSEPEKSEVQSYINELLGLEGSSSQKNKLPP